MMAFFKSIAVVALAAQSVSGHYIFQALAKGANTKGTPYQYVRHNTNMNSPVTDLSSNDLRCNAGGATGGSTSTLALNAGDTFTFSLDQAVYHQGPVSLYMSKAPSTAAAADGSGDWFKIYDWGPNFSGGQAQWTMTGTYTGTIPRCIPSGEYLLRIQSLAIHNPGATPQWYVSCGQIKVSGGGSTNPSPTVKIPGAFKASDPGYTANIYNNFRSYTVPGPAVFTC
ncbi:glycoside hydrolase family 61 protein [Xylaria bambusicola]|uniref:glycoside hydrolase family 61 protein n=1 Tax=Xylaria bambusicola TaxID=326684 RepID=UPI0020082B69|nr:glycoside hydrolase family 61 protein [Xylaria bambusicola]KAI0514463.1 glycoside hydrolase family 61 protein [Xylaria bambusicola]